MCQSFYILSLIRVVNDAFWKLWICYEINLLDTVVLANHFYSLLYNSRTHGDSHVILNRTGCIPDCNQVRSNRVHRLNDEWRTWYIRPWSNDTCSAKYILKNPSKNLICFKVAVIWGMLIHSLIHSPSFTYKHHFTVTPICYFVSYIIKLVFDFCTMYFWILYLMQLQYRSDPT